MKIDYDIIVVGSGHAGCEAAYIASKFHHKVALITMNLDSIAFLACNPSIGGTAKGQLAGEVNALGGAMGQIADMTALQIRTLNAGKGPAVQSYRAQVDKHRYHIEMKNLLERSNIDIIQAEVSSIDVENGIVSGISTTYGTHYRCKKAIICVGVYLRSDIVIGDVISRSGPNGFSPSNHLTQSIIDIGHNVYRYKTGTPARIHMDSIDISQWEVQNGDSSLSWTGVDIEKNVPCYLGYTNKNTHKIINDNIDKAPVYNGSIMGVGPRYCPSIETKVTRFYDKDRHQIFLEPESEGSKEMYMQGMSTSFGIEMQDKIYRSIQGMENAHIMRYAYAIEYDCIDSTSLNNALESKNVGGLYFAGQINGTSGYEEAAAQGIMAGINASLSLNGEPPLVLGRDEAYIGVMIDDLVTTGVDEPYRMMTSRAEFRLLLRQDNCDTRLSKYAIKYGLLSASQIEKYNNDIIMMDRLRKEMDKSYSPMRVREYFEHIGETQPKSGITLAQMLRRGNVDISGIQRYMGVLTTYPQDILNRVAIEVKYAGYIDMQASAVNELKSAESILIPNNIDYLNMGGLRIEAAQKLSQIMPSTIGQASRVRGVNPADINVLLIYIKKGEKN